MVLPNLALIYLTQQRHHILMQHRRKQLRMQRWMPEPLLQPVAMVIRTFRVDLGHADLLFSRCEVVESGNVDAVDIDLEGKDEEDRRDGGYPLEGAEFVLEANG